MQLMNHNVCYKYLIYVEIVQGHLLKARVTACTSTGRDFGMTLTADDSRSVRSGPHIAGGILVGNARICRGFASFDVDGLDRATVRVLVSFTT
jgi:hypothetical protein